MKTEKTHVADAHALKPASWRIARVVAMALAPCMAIADTISIGEGETYSASDLATVEALQNATGISIAAGGTLEYSDSSNALVLNAPISGEGTIKTTTGKSMVVLGDNSGFTGQWRLVSPVVVSNRYGLGTENTAGVYFESGATGGALKFGGAGLTNDVPIFFTVASPSGVVIFRDANDLSGPFVQNGLITHSKALTISTHDAIYRGGVKETSASLTFSMPNNSKYNNTSVRFENNPINEGGGHLILCGENSDVVNYCFDVAGSKCGDRFYIYRARLHRGAEDVLPRHYQSPFECRDVELGGKYNTTQWKTAVLDLNGFNQVARSVYCNWYGNVLEADGETYVTEVTSASAATLTLTNSLTRTTATKYTGRVSLSCNGTGTYTLANLLSTSTGTLTVGDGFTVGFKWRAGWSGDVVVKSGGTLVLDSERAFLEKKSNLSVETGGAITVTANAVVELASLRLGDREIPGGVFTREAFVAAGLGDFVAGDGVIAVADGSGADAVHGTNARDGLIFELFPKNTTADGEWVTAGDIADGATWSADAPFAPYGLCTFNPSSDPTSYAKYGTPDPISIKEVETPVAYFSRLYVTNTCNALCFPKNVRTYDEGNGRLSTNVYRMGVSYTSLPAGLQGSNMTVRLRLRWDGNVKQPTKMCYDQYIMQLYNTTKGKNILALSVETYNPTTQSQNGYLRFDLGTAGLYDTVSAIETNRWYDVFFSIKGIGGGKSEVSFYKYYWVSGSGAIDRKTAEKNSQLDVAAGDAGHLYIGNERALFNTYGVAGRDKWDSTFDGQSLRSFNGAIAKLEIYDHAMTLQEINAVMHEPGSGCTFKIGSMNASADEFAAVDDPQSLTVFDPRNDSVRRFRKALTASNPSTSIRFAMKPEENGLPRTLRLCMDRKNILTSAPVAVSVNGTSVETVDFGSTRSALVFLQPRFMRPDQDGYVTITLSRPSGCSGALLFDSVELSGSWAAGASDGVKTDWCFCGSTDFFSYAASFWDKRSSLPGGAWNRPFIPNVIYGWRKDMCENGQPIPGNTPYLPTAYFAFDVPAEVIEQGGGTFTIGSSSNDSLVEFDVFANDVNVGHVSGVTKGASYDFRLPPEVLVSGLNSLVVSNSGAKFAENAAYNSYNIFNFDFVRFKANVPPREIGMQIIIR